MKNVPLVDDGMPIEVGQFKLCVDFWRRHNGTKLAILAKTRRRLLRQKAGQMVKGSTPRDACFDMTDLLFPAQRAV